MNPHRTRPHSIWGLAFGYFAFYVPYIALTRALSQGLLPGLGGPVPGFVLLPATAIATTVVLLAFLTAGGGWRDLEHRTILGMSLPAFRTTTVGSGLATAVIIATTTLNYTAVGISILLALLLMRGGVLILAPIVDTLFARRVHVCSWIALALSLLAIGVVLSDVASYQMTLVAGLIILAYQAGYACRLSLMTSTAKSPEPSVNRRYFYEEAIVAAVALTAVPALLAVLGQGEIVGQLRQGFTTFWARPAVVAALLIGVCYACLYMFGTTIYLDRRENTFCVPLNRCSTLLSGVVASYALTVLLGLKPPSVYQLAGVGFVLTALGFLILSSVRADRRAALVLAQRVYLFVCGGNTSRSPMAQALCNAEIARRLGLEVGQFDRAPIRALSAGLTTQPGRPFSAAAVETLRGLGVTPHAHASREVTAELVRQAEAIYCMTEDQCRTLAGRYPEAAAKIQPLDPDGDLDDPSGQDATAYRALGLRLQQAIRRRLADLAV